MANSPQDARTQDQRTGAAGAAGGGDTSTFSATFVPLSSADTATSADSGQGSGATLSTVDFPQYAAQETALPHPYMLRPGPGGSYFIYLPKGCLTVDGEVIDVDQYFTGVTMNESVMKSPWYQYSTFVSSGGQAQPQSMKVKFLWNKDENKYEIQNVEFFSGEGGDDDSGDENEKEKTVTVPISEPDGAGRPSPVVSSAVHLSIFDLGARIELKDKGEEGEEESGSIVLDASGESGPKLVIEGDDKSVVLDASGESGPKLVIEGGGKSITLDPSALDDGESIAVQTITVKGDDGEDKEVKILASEEFAPGGVGVTSLNGATGDVSVIGGKGIEVSTDGQTIKVSWNKDKEDEDEDPNSGASDNGESPCDHDASGSAGGVAAGGSGDGSGASDDDFGGGVSAGGDSHSGDDDCNCD